MRSFFSQHGFRANPLKIFSLHLRILETNPNPVFSGTRTEHRRWLTDKARSPAQPPTTDAPETHPSKTSVAFEVIKESIIKPSSPTPLSLQRYKLSLIDQYVSSVYSPVVLFYPKESFDTYKETDFILEKSLSELLTYYYPFAGRLVGINYVDCNDMGVMFREVRLGCSVSELLEKPHATLQDSVFPAGLAWGNNVPPNGEGCLVIAQLSHFDCGGKSISVCVHHKVGDAATVANFLSDWTAITRKSTEKPCPLFNGATIYPPIEYTNAPEDIYFKRQETPIITRIIFDSSKIKHLKTLASSKSSVKNPTRTEVVTALLLKSCAAASMVDSPSFKPIVLITIVNLRSRTNAPIQQNSMGNFFCYLHLTVSNEEDMKLESLVAKIRSEKLKIYEKYKVLNEDERVAPVRGESEFLKEMIGKDHCYNVTSACGFGYEGLDFGWGKPFKVSYGAIPEKNFFILISDATGKGVEAITTLDEKVLEVIRRDQEFLSFATL